MTTIKIKKFFERNERHVFHLVDTSQLPLITGWSVFLFVCSCTLYLNPLSCRYVTNIDDFVFQLAVFIFISVLMAWFLTVVYESGQGDHTQLVRRGLRWGMVLFIVSEVMFFFAFFWAFFHVSLSPAIILGCVWPPKGIQQLDVWSLPLMNTILLLSSGVTLTLAHRAMLRDNIDTNISLSEKYLFATVILGITFLCCQGIEYKYGISFSWWETIYGSTFFVTTGFHGFHVTIGTIFLIFCLIRSVVTTIPISKIMKYFMDKNISLFINYLSFFSFRKEQHVGFEAAAWYWHFVDVVWIFLFITVYWWGS